MDRIARSALAGAVVWIAVVALRVTHVWDLTLIDLLLLLAPLVVVPIARPLLPGRDAGGEVLHLAAAFGVVAAFVPSTGGPAAALAAPWLVLLAADALRSASAWLRAPSTEIARLLGVLARGYVVVGAFFTVASRAGRTVAGVREPIVELTGVHFHFVGFATMAIAAALARELGSRPRVARPGIALLALAPPFVAAGFTWTLEVPQIVGAILLAAGAWWIAIVSLVIVVPRWRGTPRLLLAVSSIAVVAPMVLAVLWAAGQYTDVPALSIPAMARVHGTLNGFGFVGCGLLAWTLHPAPSP